MTTKVNNRMIDGARINVLDFGADPTGTVSSSDAFEAARAAGNALFVPEGVYLLTRNFTLHDKQTIQGLGQSSQLTLDDCWFGLDGDTAGEALSHCLVQDLTLRRINSSSNNDSVFVVRGGSTDPALDVYRFTIRNIHVQGNYASDLTTEMGNGYQMGATYLGSIENPIVQNCRVGFSLDTWGTRSTGVNAVSFTGGEVQSCGYAAIMHDVANCGFYSTVFEGSTIGGVWLDSECNGVGFYNTYTESLASYDFKLSADRTGVTNTACVFNGVTVRSGSRAKNHSLVLESCIGLDVNGYYAKGPTGYDVSIIGNKGSGSTVQGLWSNVADPFLNPFRNAPIAPSAEAVGTPLVDKETYGFFNTFRNIYEQDFSQADAGTSETFLRDWTFNSDLLSRFGVPITIKTVGSLTSSTGTKTLSVFYDNNLIKNFTTTAVNEDYKLDMELSIDPTNSNLYRLSMTFMVDGETSQYHQTVFNDTSDMTIKVSGSAPTAGGLNMKSSYYRVNR